MLVLLFLLVATLLVYGRIIGHDFQVTWDDDRYIIDNPMVHGLTLDHVRQAFAAQYFGNYAPLHLMSYMLDFEIWELWPGGYQLTNLIIHVLNGLLIYRAFFQLHGRRLMATVGAFVFLLHPLQVESVAWVSQRKNLLAMLFFLLAWEAYRRYREMDGGLRLLTYCGALILFACSVLSKSVAVIFPVVIILYDGCFPLLKDGKKEESLISRIRSLSLPVFIKTEWRSVADKVPFIMVALLTVVLTMQSQTPVGDNWDGAGGGRVGYHGGSPLATFYSMLPVFCRYLGLLVWPAGLNAQYNPTVHTYADSAVVVAGGFLAFVAWLMFRLLRYDRKTGFWVVVFCVGFLPVSQIVPLVTMMNDRYVYFPMIGFAALIGAGCSALKDMLPRQMIPAFYVIGGSLLTVMSGATFQRAGVWSDSVMLWSDSVAKSPTLSSSWTGLAQAYERTGNGMVNEAIQAYNRAFALDPANAYVLYGLGRAYGFTGQYDKALHFTNALLKISPGHVMGVTQLGTIYEKQGKYDLAEKCYLQALSLQPEALEVAMSLASLSVLRGDLITARRRYLQIESKHEKYPVVAYMLAWLELQSGQEEPGLIWLEKALQRGYAEYESVMDLKVMLTPWGMPRFEQLLQRYGGGLGAERS